MPRDRLDVHVLWFPFDLQLVCFDLGRVIRIQKTHKLICWCREPDLFSFPLFSFCLLLISIGFAPIWARPYTKGKTQNLRFWCHGTDLIWISFDVHLFSSDFHLICSDLGRVIHIGKKHKLTCWCRGTDLIFYVLWFPFDLHVVCSDLGKVMRIHKNHKLILWCRGTDLILMSFDFLLFSSDFNWMCSDLGRVIQVGKLINWYADATGQTWFSCPLISVCFLLM